MSSLVFSSPRRRRHAGRLVLAGGLVAVLIAVIAALPSRTPSKRDTLRPGPPQAVRTAKEVALTPARRRAINAVLDRFVPSALERRNLEIARGLVTSSFAAGVTDAQWRRGEIPVFPYKPRDTTFHGWTQNYGYRNEVSLDILVHPSAEEVLGAIAFTAVLKRKHNRWLIDTFVPAASFAKEKKAPRILAPPDFQPNMVTGPNDKSRLSASWLLLPAAVLALIVLVPIGVLLLNVRRNRRALLAYRRGLT
jgi:hypothetical protein